MQLTNKGQGWDGRETGFMWMLIGTPHGDVVYWEYVYKGTPDATEMSTDNPDLTKEDMLEISEQVGYLWSEDVPKIKRPHHFVHNWSW